jgi:myo-inositol-1(or 4)-monophosphatase
MKELEVARSGARAGAEILRRYFHEGVDIRSKGGASLVSDADVESENAIAELIREALPGHAVLGEEEHAAAADAEHLWIVDPLDGTSNFAHHIPHFSVSIAYYHSGEPQCGVIFNPMRDDWYEAVRGAGATYNGRAVHVSDESQLSETLVGVGFYYDRGAMMEATLAAIRDLFHAQIHGIRRFATASLDLCHVGCGFYGAFFEYELSPWDFAAGRLFIEEAGGSVTTCDGSELPIARGTLLASNGKLHEAMLEITRRHLPGG